jgi:hypothetical protein
MSDQSSPSKSTSPRTSLKQEEAERSRAGEHEEVIAGDTQSPEESQVGEPPPGGGPRPGEDIH